MLFGRIDVKTFYEQSITISCKPITDQVSWDGGEQFCNIYIPLV